jgi:5-methylcytosine-specific restriction endonuclease McrA
VFKRDGCTRGDCGIEGKEKRNPSGAITHPTIVPGIYLSAIRVIPRSLGGESADANLQTICTSCNARRRAH